MINEPSLGIDVGSTGCRFAVIHDGAPLPVWVPRQFDHAIADAAMSAGSGSDVVEESLAWKNALGETESSGWFGEEFIHGLFRRGLAAAATVIGALPVRAVLCMPTSYTARQRQLLHRCALAAGLHDTYLIGDTLALAIAHSHNEPTGQFLVYHVGHMRLEIGVISLLNRCFEVLNYRSHDILSGRVLESLLLEILTEALHRPRAMGLEYSLVETAALRRSAEKVRLCFSQHNTVSVKMVVPGGPAVIVKISCEDWLRRMEPLILESMRLVDEALAQVRLQPAQLTQVLLGGGATAWPPFHQILAAHFSQPVHRLHDWAAAFGAARLATSLTSRALPRDVDWNPEVSFGTERTNQPIVLNLNLSPAHDHSDSPSTKNATSARGIPENPPSAPSVGHRLAQRALEQARTMLEQRQLQAAVSLSHQACQDDDKDPEIFAAMLDIHCQAARASDGPDGYLKALEWLHCANGHAPGNTTIRQALAERHLLHARQMMKYGRVPEASQAVQLAFELRPECPETERLLLEIQLLSGNEGR